jgi:hypothetical protein
MNRIAQTSGGLPSWLQKTTDRFNHSIARRIPGNRLELAAARFLYESKP